MAIAGAAIVMTGLTVLSFIISQLHKVIGLLEKKAVEVAAVPDYGSSTAAPKKILLDLDDIDNVAQQIKALAAGLGNDFSLVALYRQLDTAELPHPHITVRQLREAGYLVRSGEGSFSWSKV
jgi:hypothetical protein